MSFKPFSSKNAPKNNVNDKVKDAAANDKPAVKTEPGKAPIEVTPPPKA